MLKTFLHPLHTSKDAARKIEYYKRNNDTNSIIVHHVLTHLCQQLDRTELEDADESVEDTNEKHSKVYYRKTFIAQMRTLMSNKIL